MIELTEGQKDTHRYFEERAEELRIRSDGLNKQYIDFLSWCMGKLEVPDGWKFSADKLAFIDTALPVAEVSHSSEEE